MKTPRFLLWLILVLALTGCASTKTVWKCEPEVQRVSNETFDAQLSVECEKTGCMGFVLFFENKSHRDIDIDWSKTVYLMNGEEGGGFVFEGIILRNKKDRKALETVVAYGLSSRKIVPEALTVAGKRGEQPHLGPGEHGIRLVVRADGREITERLSVIILRMEFPE